MKTCLKFSIFFIVKEAVKKVEYPRLLSAPSGLVSAYKACYNNGKGTNITNLRVGPVK
jgi:hypothetical protein